MKKNIFKLRNSLSKIFKIQNFGMLLCLGCFFTCINIVANLAMYWMLFAFLFFYCLKTMENNKKAMITIEIVKKVILL